MLVRAFRLIIPWAGGMKSRAQTGSTMNLDESQQQKVRSWVEQGLQAADIQKRLADELELQQKSP